MKVLEENMGEYIYNCEIKRSSKTWHKTQKSWKKTLINLTNKWKTTFIAKAPIKLKIQKKNERVYLLWQKNKLLNIRRALKINRKGKLSRKHGQIMLKRL